MKNRKYQVLFAPVRHHSVEFLLVGIVWKDGLLWYTMINNYIVYTYLFTKNETCTDAVYN